MKLLVKAAIFLLIATAGSPRTALGKTGDLAAVLRAAQSVVRIQSEAANIFNAGQHAAMDPQTGRIYVLTDLVSAQYNRSGAGIILDRAGHIATNLHTVKDAGQITVTLTGGVNLTATLVHTVDEKDLAFLKIDPPQPLVPIELADSNFAGIGEAVYATGSTPANQGTISGGHVMGVNHSEEPEKNGVKEVSVIQIRFVSEMYKGDSGNPILNEDGKVLGIVAAGNDLVPEAVYALPSNVIRQYYSELIGREKSETSNATSPQM